LGKYYVILAWVRFDRRHSNPLFVSPKGEKFQVMASPPWGRSPKGRGGETE